MNQQTPEKEEFIEINFQRIFETLLKKAWLITIVSILCAVLALGYTHYFVTPQYQSSYMTTAGLLMALSLARSSSAVSFMLRRVVA